MKPSILFLAIGVLVAGTAAQAGVVTLGTASATVIDPTNSTSVSHDFNQTHTPGVTSGSASAVDPSGATVSFGGFTFSPSMFAAALAQGQAHYGSLAATANAIAKGDYSNALSQCSTQPCIEAAHKAIARAFAGAGGSFGDSITLTSSTLPVGTDVSLIVGFMLHTEHSVTGAVVPPTDELATMDWAVDSFSGAFDGITGARDQSTSVRIDAKIGDTIFFMASLGVTSFATTDWTDWSQPFDDLSALTSTRATMRIRLLDPDAGYTAESGTVYATEFPTVPEPLSLALMLGGLASLACFARSRSNRVRY
jgi:hypothetical protein